MDAALLLLEKNKFECIEQFRQILHHPEARFDALKQTINPIAKATFKEQVLSKPSHVSKYLRLIFIITEHRPHVEHMNCEEWAVFTQFLVVAYEHLKSALQGLEFVKSTHELFYGLSMLLNSTESLECSLFDSIISVCKDFLMCTTRRETVCHPYIMKCLRILTSLGVKAAAEVGEMLLQLKHFKSPSLVYEISLFACLKPQSMDILVDLSPRLIQSREVEFVPGPELGSTWFRPTSEADLRPFATALALSFAITRIGQRGPSDMGPSHKRIKTRDRVLLSDGLRFMIDAFRSRQLEDVNDVLGSLMQNSSDRRSCGLAPESLDLSSGESKNFTSVFLPNDNVDHAGMKFWAFTLLARQCEFLTKCRMLLLWDICLESVQNDEASSAVCLCLSRLTTELLKPSNVDGNVVDRIRALLSVMGNSSYPNLSSGSLTLYSILLRTKVIDEDFQAFIFQQLRKWLSARVESGPSILLAQLFDFACPAAYLQSDLAAEIEATVALTRVQSCLSEIKNDMPSPDMSQKMDYSRRNSLFKFSKPTEKYSPSVTSVPQWQARSIKDSLWFLALSARNGYKIIGSSQSTNNAFTDQDLQAFVWYANLANYFQWDKMYSREALALASWESPAKTSESILKAMELLKSPGPVVSTLLCGYWSPHINVDLISGLDLRTVEPILKQYHYQRSPSILRSLANVVRVEVVRNINEAKQLRSFLVQVSSKQSIYSSLKWYCRTSEDISEFLQSISSQPDILKLGFLINQEHRALIFALTEQNALEFAAAFDKSFQITVLFILYQFKLIGLAKLCLSIAKSFAESQIVQQLVKRLVHLSPKSSLVNLVKVPLLFARISSQSYLEVLRWLGASDSDKEWLEQLKDLENINPERCDDFLRIITENLMRECSSAASDDEISHCISKLFTIIQAHRPEPSAFLRLHFFKNALALLIAFKQRELGGNRCWESYKTIKALIDTFVKPSQDLELRISVSLLLWEAGYTNDAAELLISVPNAVPSNIYDVVCGLHSTSIKEFSAVWRKLDTVLTSLQYELRKTALRHASEIVKLFNSDDVLQSLLELEENCIRQLIEWTNYVMLPHEDTWLAVIGRLAASKGIFTVEVSMRRCLYAVSLPECRISNDIGGFKFVLEKVYQHLPYVKKWLLHPFVEQNNWESHIELLREAKPKSSKPRSIKPYHTGPSSSGSLAEIVISAVRLLDLPHLGPDILNEIPELFLEVIPVLISIAFGVESGSSPRSEILHLQNNLRIGLRSPDTRENVLRILRKCYEMHQKLVLSSSEIAQACVAHGKSTSSPQFVEFGWIAVEKAWNNDPSVPISSDLQECLRYFYAVKDDTCELSSLYSSNKNLIDSLKRDSMPSPWQNLELEMAQSEVLAQMNLPSSSEVTSSLKLAGLWNFGQKAFPNSGFYDLEKSWWLHQWDAASIYYPRKSSYDRDIKEFTSDSELENPEFGAIIGYFKGRFSADEVYADLTQINIRMTRIFDNMRISENDQRIRLPFELEDEREYAIAQFGQEALFSAKGRVSCLIRCLKDSCEHFRKVKDIHSMLQCTIKLDHLRQLHLPDGIDKALECSYAQDLFWVSQLEVARTQWEMGRSSQALLSLKRLVNSQIFEKEKHQDLADAYGLLGSWSRFARDERDDAILQNYFLPAVELTNNDNRERVQHLFARFCDDVCHDKTQLSAIEDSARVIDNEKLQSEYLAKAIQGGNTEKAYQNRYRISLRMLRAETENLEGLKKKRQEMTLKCIQAYLISLKYGDNYEEDMGRFVALWLELCTIKEVNRLVLKGVFEAKEGSFPLHKFVPWMNQLSSRLGDSDLGEFQSTLKKLLSQTVVMHPFHSLWPLINILRTKSNLNKTSLGRKSAAKEVVQFVSERLPSVILHTIEFADRMAQLGISKPKGEEKKFELQNIVSSTAAHWWKSRLFKMRLPVPIASIPISIDGDYEKIPCVESVKSEIVIAGGISAPKIVTLVDSQGSVHKMVLKGSEKDDLRQDAIMQQVFQTASGLFSHTPSFKLARKLRVRTYNVIPLGETCGAIEFVRNTMSLQDILEPLHALYGGPSEYSLRKARKNMHTKRDFNAAIRVATFEDVMEHTKPQMRHFWTKRFRDPHDWLEAKTSWCRSTAVTSILGYIVGLGDRHCSNLLVDTATGEVVHIDLGIAFDQGKQLYIPETVPFRLTRDMVDGMGIHGTSGIFTSAAEATLKIIREQRDRIMTVIEVLKHDALYTWRLPPLRLNKIQSESHYSAEIIGLDAPRVETGLAEHALRSVKQKLTATLSCEAMVRDLTAQARSTENLAVIFSGWSPFY